MDYQLARQIRGTSLKNLITGRIASGQGVGHALSMAVSDKFRAKAVGMKAKFDPLNIMKKMFFGSNLLTAVAGRAMGRSSRDIAYFTGINMRNRKYKDPKRNTVAPGRVTQVKIGDSGTDVLAKMFNFMVKTHEEEIKRYELEKEFRQEQKDEDERRHEELLEAIINKKRVSKRKTTDDMKESVEKPEGLGDKIFGGLFGGLKSLGSMAISPFKVILNLIKGFAFSVAGMFTKIFSVLETLFVNVGQLILTTVMSVIGSALTGVIGTIVTSSAVILKKLIDTAVIRTLIGIFDKLPGFGKVVSALKIAGQVALGSYLVGELFKMDAALVETAVPKETINSVRNIQESESGEGSKLSELKKQQAEESAKGNRGSPTKLNDLNKNIAEETKRITALKQAALDQGYKDMEDYLKRLGITIDFAKRDSQYAKPGDIEALTFPTFSFEGKEIPIEALGAAIRFGESFSGSRELILGDYKGAANKISQSTKELPEKISEMYKGSKLEDIVSEGTKNMTLIIDQVEEKLERIKVLMSDKFKDMEQAMGGTVVNQQTNVSKTTDAVDASPISSRNQDDSLQRCLATGAVGC